MYVLAQANIAYGVLAELFLSRNHQMYMENSLTYYVSESIVGESIVRGIHLPGGI